MRTKELLSKDVITRDEKIAHLKKLGLWREYQNEVKKGNERDLNPISSLDELLNCRADWIFFLYGSFTFACTAKGYDFWAHVANYGERPDRPKHKYKPISVYDFDFTLSGYGRYKVTYTSASGKNYTTTITDMTVIDATKNSDSPRAKDLKVLKDICITNNYL